MGDGRRQVGGGRWKVGGDRWEVGGDRWEVGGRWEGGWKGEGERKRKGKSYDPSIRLPIAALPISCARSATGRRKTATNL